MHFAVAVNNLSLAKALDEYGADATVKNDEGQCPIEIAQQSELNELVLHFMAQ